MFGSICPCGIKGFAWLDKQEIFVFSDSACVYEHAGHHSTSSIRHTLVFLMMNLGVIVIVTNIALTTSVNFIIVLITIIVLTGSVDLIATSITFNAVPIARSIIFFVELIVTSINDISSVTLVATFVL